MSSSVPLGKANAIALESTGNGNRLKVLTWITSHNNPPLSWKALIGLIASEMSYQAVVFFLPLKDIHDTLAQC